MSITRTRIQSVLWIIFFFSVAMGFFEAIVVVYLREIAYPKGFNFPLKSVPVHLFITEIVREICTLVMLVSIAWLAVSKKVLRFAMFLFSFAIWDIIYYVALKLFLNWPESFLTWDVLFLVPIVWVSPVLAPNLCTVAMLILTFVIIEGDKRLPQFKITRIEWVYLVTGSCLVLISFLWDHAKLIIHYRSNPNLENILLSYVPYQFQWSIFLVGFGFISWTIIQMFLRVRSIKFNV